MSKMNNIPLSENARKASDAQIRQATSEPESPLWGSEDLSRPASDDVPEATDGYESPFQAAQDPNEGLIEWVQAEMAEAEVAEEQRRLDYVAIEHAVRRDSQDERYRAMWLRVHYTNDDEPHNSQADIAYFVWSSMLKLIQRREMRGRLDANPYESLVRDYKVSLDKRVSIFLKKPVSVQRITVLTDPNIALFQIPWYKIQLE